MYRVMLADDEPIMRKALVSLTDWQELDCEVVFVAANGQEVLEHLEESRPDILVTDIQMPGSDGIALAKHIYENHLPVKVIILTAYADFSYAQSAVKYGVVDYVTKTGAFDGLIAAVERCKKLLRAQAEISQEALRENFFKAVYDGSLYDPAEIQQRFGQLDCDLDQYCVLFVYFLVDEKQEQEKKTKTQHSLRNFYQMVFGEQMQSCIFLKKDMLCIILNQMSADAVEHLSDQCVQIMDMMDNFLELYAYMGISQPAQTVKDLRQAYGQAQAALEWGLEEERDKLNFYRASMEKAGELSLSSPVRNRVLVEECVAYIKEHYQESCSVGEVAKAIGTSPSYLSRIFREFTGSTIIHTIHEKKLEKAKEYLTETDMKIYEIADALSFENVTYFSRFFKKNTGVSPKDYK
ncbi:MAG: response regulator [Lachnospiraceae bacterium]|nr:response regulator [Lachnospiraceae bacterium]